MNCEGVNVIPTQSRGGPFCIVISSIFVAGHPCLKTLKLPVVFCIEPKNLDETTPPPKGIETSLPNEIGLFVIKL